MNGSRSRIKSDRPSVGVITGQAFLLHAVLSMSRCSEEREDTVIIYKKLKWDAKRLTGRQMQLIVTIYHMCVSPDGIPAEF